MAFRERRRRGRGIRRIGLAAAGCAAAVAGCGGSHTPAPPGSHPLAAKANKGPRVARDRLSRRRVYLGRSVDGRRIYAVKVGDLDNPRSVLVVGDIHGNESAGIPVAQSLASSPPSRESLIIVIKDLNPDGVAAGTRQNARGVDLNRNFPYRWRPLGSPGRPPVFRSASPLGARDPHRALAHSAGSPQGHRSGFTSHSGWSTNRAAASPSSDDSRGSPDCHCTGSRDIREARRAGRTTACRGPRRSSSSCRRGGSLLPASPVTPLRSEP